MPIATRISTPIPRAYLCDERLNALSDPLAREAYMRAKLVCDNLGRLPANPPMLGGILFPANPPNSTKMAKIIEAWAAVGLVFHYRVGQRAFIEIADNGATSRLIGHMTDQSEYPAPPAELIEAWREKFACDWKPIARSGSKVGKDSVDTRSNGLEHVQTSSPEVSSVGGVEKGSELVSGVGEVDSTDLPTHLDDVCFDPYQPSNAAALESVFKVVSKGKPVGTAKFQRVILMKLKERNGKKPNGKKEWERFMSEVLDECMSRTPVIGYPREWFSVLSDLREKIRDEE